MQAGTTAFGHGLRHEGQQISAAICQFARHHPEQHGIVAGLQRIIETQGHLELAVVIFAIHRLDGKTAFISCLPDHVDKPGRVIFRTGAIDKGPRRVIGAPDTIGITLEDKGLQLQPDHRRQAGLLPVVHRLHQQRSWAQIERLAVNLQPAQRDLGIRLPCRAPFLVEHHFHVGKPLIEAGSRNTQQFAVIGHGEGTTRKSDAAAIGQRRRDIFATRQIHQIAENSANTLCLVSSGSAHHAAPDRR